jgi:hypothetical protein
LLSPSSAHEKLRADHVQKTQGKKCQVITVSPANHFMPIKKSGVNAEKQLI